jgi:hypothetical protein
MPSSSALPVRTAERNIFDVLGPFPCARLNPRQVHASLLCGMARAATK